MSEQLFVKVGRRYVPWGNAERYDADMLRAGTWRMTYCHADGSSRYSYDVRPDTASFLAACELAMHAMECAIAAASVASPSMGRITPYTKAQLALVERFRADTAAAGGLVPSYWQHSTAREIAQAGIDAVRAFAGGAK